MFSRPSLTIFGAGGYAKAIFDACCAGGVPVAAFAERSPEPGAMFMGLPILAEAAVLTRPDAPHIALGIGDNWLRCRLAGAVQSKRPDVQFCTVRHPAAQISSHAHIGEGTVLLAGCFVGPSASIGRHVTLWSNSVAEHDTVLEECVTLAPGAKTGGQAFIGARAFLGVNASVNDGVRIGADTVVGSQGAVVRDLPPAALAMGVPARVVRMRTPGEPYLERSSERNG